MIQQLREAFPHDTERKYLIFDRDAIFSLAVADAVKAMGIEPRRIAYRSPWQNAVAERWIGSCRRELLEHVAERFVDRLASPTSHLSIIPASVVPPTERGPSSRRIMRNHRSKTTSGAPLMNATVPPMLRCMVVIRFRSELNGTSSCSVPS